MEKLMENKNKLERLRWILEDFTEYVESHTDHVANYVMADNVLEYINDMWKVFEDDDKE